MKSSLVSVIIPVYNSEKHLRPCLESVIHQSYRNIEIVLINDGSTDASGSLCHDYAARDARIRVIDAQNGGPSAARNLGMQNSKGEFICFVDSDDLMEREAVRLLVENQRETSADMIAGDFKIDNYKAGPAGGRFHFACHRLLGKQDIIDCVRSYLRKPAGYSIFLQVWAKLFKTSIIQENKIRFDANLRVFEDLSFNHRYLRYCASASYVRARLYTYMNRDTPESAGMRIIDNPVGYKLALRSLEEFLIGNGVDVAVIEREMGHACVSLAIKMMVQMFALNEIAGTKSRYALISGMLDDADIRRSLRYYSPSKGDSRILPLLMEWRLVALTAWVCRYKALAIRCARRVRAWKPNVNF